MEISQGALHLLRCGFEQAARDLLQQQDRDARALRAQAPAHVPLRHGVIGHDVLVIDSRQVQQQHRDHARAVLAGAAVEERAAVPVEGLDHPPQAVGTLIKQGTVHIEHAMRQRPAKTAGVELVEQGDMRVADRRVGMLRVRIGPVLELEVAAHVHHAPQPVCTQVGAVGRAEPAQGARTQERPRRGDARGPILPGKGISSQVAHVMSALQRKRLGSGR